MDFITNILNMPIIPIGNDNYLTLATVLFAVLLVAIVMLLLSLLAKKVKSNREERALDAYEQYCRITKWQRQALPQIFEKYDKKGDLNYILKYMDENTVWYTDELNDYDYEIVTKTNKVLFNEVRNNFRKNDYCFFILHAIDAINGGLDVTENDEYEPWISDRVSSGLMEDRVKIIYSNAMRHLTDQYKQNPTQNKLPDETIRAALLDLRETDLWLWEEDTYKILLFAMIQCISDNYINRSLNDIGLSYIRALAALFDHNDYMDSLESLDD